MKTPIEILSLAIIGKHDQPIYLRNLTHQTGGEADLKWYYAAHTSLDVFDERDGLSPKVLGCYFGLLYSLDDYACYGFQSNTKIRFVLCLPVKEIMVRDSDVKAVFRAIHAVYIRYISNPFLPISIDQPRPIGETIKSKSFDRLIDQIIRP